MSTQSLSDKILSILDDKPKGLDDVKASMTAQPRETLDIAIALAHLVAAGLIELCPGQMFTRR